MIHPDGLLYMASAGVKSLPSACGCPVFPAAPTEEDALSPVCSSRKNKPTNVCKKKQLDFYSVSLVYTEYRSTAFWCPGCSGACVWRRLPLQLFAFSLCLASCSQYLLTVSPLHPGCIFLLACLSLMNGPLHR